MISRGTFYLSLPGKIRSEEEELSFFPFLGSSGGGRGGSHPPLSRDKLAKRVERKEGKYEVPYGGKTVTHRDLANFAKEKNSFFKKKSSGHASLLAPPPRYRYRGFTILLSFPLFLLLPSGKIRHDFSSFFGSTIEVPLFPLPIFKSLAYLRGCRRWKF